MRCTVTQDNSIDAIGYTCMKGCYTTLITEEMADGNELGVELCGLKRQ